MTGDPVAEAAAAALRGELIVLPTDTVYGIAARPDDADAVGRLFHAKGRPRHLELPVLASSLDEARTVAEFGPAAERVAAACWPGGLTLVLPRTERSRSWRLGAAGVSTVGVRVPRHPLALAVLAAAGPLAVTSANRSGEPPARTCDELHATFGEDVALYLCEERPLEGAASTVVDLAHGAPAILRQGAVSPAVVLDLLAGEGPLLDSRPSP